MSKQIAVDEIINATLAGIKQSQKQYEKWSNGGWLWTAPEYLITVNVAKKIFEIDGPKYITLENNSKATIDDAGAIGQGRLPNDIRPKGKVDILLWWGNDTPRAIIEIKNFIYDYKNLAKDIKRTKELLKHQSKNSSLEFGLLGYCDSANDNNRRTAEQRIDEKQLKIKNLIKEILGEDFILSSKSLKPIPNIKDSAWCATCIKMQYKPKKQ